MSGELTVSMLTHTRHVRDQRIRALSTEANAYIDGYRSIRAECDASSAQRFQWHASERSLVHWEQGRSDAAAGLTSSTPRTNAPLSRAGLWAGAIITGLALKALALLHALF